MTNASGAKTSVVLPKGDAKQVTLVDVLKELQELQPPPSVDKGIFAQIKDELEKQLSAKGLSKSATAGKFTSKPPTGEANRVTDLTLIDNGDGTYTLTWTYKNVGDYNQDGTVDIADITPLAEHFFESARPTNEWIDGNRDGTIDIADVTPLAENFFTQVAGYVIEASPIGGEFSEFSRTTYSPKSNNDEAEIITHTIAEEDIGELFYFRVVAYDGEGELSDVSSNTVHRPFIPGNPPVIVSVSPVSGDSGSAQTLTAQVSGDTPISYQFDFAGGAEPAEVTGVIESYEGEYAEITVNITLSRGGDLLEPTKNYLAKLTLTNASGQAVSDIPLTVTAVWHIEEIPKVPGYDNLSEADYFFGPDGSLWGRQAYLLSEPPWGRTFFVRILDGELVEYEEINGYFAVDSDNNPARIYSVSTGFMTADYYFSRRVEGVWSEGEFLIDGRFGIIPQVFFDSNNEPVIVFARLLNSDSSDLWVARKIGDEWELTQVREAGPAISHLSAELGSDDRLQFVFSSQGNLYYAKERTDDWTIEMLKESWFDMDGYVHSYKPLDFAVDGAGTLLLLFAEEESVSGYFPTTIWIRSGSDTPTEDSLYSYTTMGSGIAEGLNQVVFFEDLTVVTFWDPVESAQKLAWGNSPSWTVEDLVFAPWGTQIWISPEGWLTLSAIDVFAQYW